MTRASSFTLLALALALAWAAPVLASSSRPARPVRDPDGLREVGSAGGSVPVPAPSPVVVDGRDLSLFSALPADPHPAQIIRGVHYWVGNEDRIDVFSPTLRALRGKGGVHIGVGAEQNWVFAGWSRPDVVVMMDFDQAIVDLHHLYLAAFAEAVTRHDFRALFVNDNATALRAAVLRRYAPGPVRDGALQALTVARHRIARRIGRLVAHLPARGVTSFLTDDDDYGFVRGLALGGRVFVVRGDLTGPGTMRAIAAASRAADLRVATLYMSNAEQYFKYTERTRENLSGLPWAAGGVALRTHGDDSLSWVDSTAPFSAVEADLEYLPASKPKDNFHYNVQTGASLQASLASSDVDDALDILRRAPSNTTAVRGLTRLVDAGVVVAGGSPPGCHPSTPPCPPAPPAPSSLPVAAPAPVPWESAR